MSNKGPVPLAPDHLRQAHVGAPGGPGRILECLVALLIEIS